MVCDGHPRVALLALPRPCLSSLFTCESLNRYWGEYPYSFACCRGAVGIMDSLWHHAVDLRVSNRNFVGKRLFRRSLGFASPSCSHPDKRTKPTKTAQKRSYYMYSPPIFCFRCLRAPLAVIPFQNACREQKTTVCCRAASASACATPGAQNFGPAPRLTRLLRRTVPRFRRRQRSGQGPQRCGPQPQRSGQQRLEAGSRYCQARPRTRTRTRTAPHRPARGTRAG